MLNIFAVLTVLKWRRKKVNDADVISDATIVDEDNVNQKKPKKQFSFFNRQQNNNIVVEYEDCLLYTSPSPRDAHESRMPSSA